MDLNQIDVEFEPVAKHLRLDARISAGLHRKCDRLQLDKEARAIYFDEWFEKYGEAKRRKLDFLFEEQDGKCCFCSVEVWRFHQTGQGLPGSHRATLEHKRPKAFGGTDALQNLAMSCSRCNNNRGVISFDKYLTESPEDFATRREREAAARERRAQKKATDPKHIARIQQTTFNLALLLIVLDKQAKLVDSKQTGASLTV